MPGLGTTGRALAWATHLAHFGHYRVEPVVRVSLKVERHVHCRDQFVLKFPWPIADNPARVRVLG